MLFQRATTLKGLRQGHVRLPSYRNAYIR